MRTTPRVLQVGKFYPPHRGGIETHLQTLCEHLLPNAGVAVVVANQRRHTVAEVVNGVAVTRLGRAMQIDSVAVCPGLAAHIRRAQVDIVHLHWPHPAGACAWWASRNPAPLVITYHSDIVRQRILGRLMRPAIDGLLARATAIIVTSPNYLDSSPLLQRHRDRCHIIPLAVPDEYLRPPDEEAGAGIRRRYGPNLVVAVGRLVGYKGFEYLIDAMRDVEGTLLLAGDGPLRAALARRARKHGLAERVVLLGDVPDIKPFLHAADLFVLPSVERSEAFGIAQAEAMAGGLPVVNTALDSGVPFVSVNGLTGITVPPRDAAALAVAINSLFRDPGLRAKYAAAARQRAAEEFDGRRMASRTLAVYARVLAAGGDHRHALP